MAWCRQLLARAVAEAAMVVASGREMGRLEVE